jgi:hypothetical protein
VNRSVIQIVPQLPPPHEGVGSFALSLADALRAQSGIESRFLVGSRSWAPDPSGGEFGAVPIPSAEAGSLRQALETATRTESAPASVLLHYANYGYQARGCPAWLIDGLAKWRAGGGGRLVTVFHEFRATGPVWRSSFWLGWRQRRLAAALARISDGIVTTMVLHRRLLRQWVPKKEIAVSPVFSTVGEPAATTPLADRVRRLVVFGGLGTRARAYRELRVELELSCRNLGIEEVCDIGPGGQPPVGSFPVPVRHLGPLPSSEISELLANSLAGFLAYPPPFLPKSTIFAAYCAHRVLPICAWSSADWSRRTLDEPMPPYWQPRNDADASSGVLQDLADRARDWYRGHALDRQVDLYRGLLFP